FTGPVSGTLSAANVSAGSFGANTGGGNYSFPSIIYAGADFRVAGDGYTIMNGNQFYCNNANNCHFNYSGTGGTHVGNSAGTTLYGPVSIGSTLTVSGNWSLGGLAQTNLAMGNKNILGVNKITAVTIDPLYDIGGEKYSTYVSSIAGGVKEEITGVARMKTENKSEKISYEIDFSDLKKGSDLWLFYQVTDFGENWENLVAILTPNFEGKTWYEKSPDKNKLVIFAIPNSNYGGSTSINLEVSYRLTANRVDWQKWPTLAIDQDEEAGFILKLK
ncbi:hypothetical protein JW698_02845, partial [Candidatus Wolfebacteria bacterium]|nr:hypothetical protein [Candidatus Wolfebacteria bacterium]